MIDGEGNFEDPGDSDTQHAKWSGCVEPSISGEQEGLPEAAGTHLTLTGLTHVCSD